MTEEEQFAAESAARDVLVPWTQKIAPFQKVEFQYYISERNRAGKAIAERVAFACGAKIEKTRLDRLIEHIVDVAEWRRNPPDHLASGW